MKKYISVILVLIISALLCSCNDAGRDVPAYTGDADISDSGSFDAADGSEHTHSQDEEGHGAQTFFSDSIEYFEIELPADGETLQYPEPFVLYESSGGETLTVSAAQRNGDMIYFDIKEEQTPFTYLSMTLLSKGKEIFLSLNPTNDESSPYDFYLSKHTSADNDYIEGITKKFKTAFGAEYSSEKCYYYVLYHSTEDGNVQH